MKALALIPLLVCGCIGVAALMLKLSGLRMNLLDPVVAAAITTTTAVIGILPILRTRQTDAVGIVQLALVGTVLHVFGTFVVAAVLVFAHVETLRGGFVYWLLGAYWVSLIVLVWQLRIVLLRLTGNLSRDLSHSLSDNLQDNLKVQN